MHKNLIGATTLALILGMTPNIHTILTNSSIVYADEHVSGFYDTESPQAKPPQAGQTGGPTITVSKNKFLVKVGDSFDFGKELGLKIIDEKDGDMTDEVGAVPDIPTNTPKIIKKTLKAVNSEGKYTTLNLVINVIDIESSTTVTNDDALQSLDPSKLVKGSVDGLTMSIRNIDKSANTFNLEVSDGASTIEQNIKYTESNPTDGQVQDNEDQVKDETDKPSNEDTGSKEEHENKEDTNVDANNMNSNTDSTNTPGNSESSDNTSSNDSSSSSNENNTTTSSNGDNSSNNSSSSSESNSSTSNNSGSSSSESNSSNESTSSSSGNSTSNNNTSSSSGNSSSSSSNTSVLPKTGTVAVPIFAVSSIGLGALGLKLYRKRLNK